MVRGEERGGGHWGGTGGGTFQGEKWMPMLRATGVDGGVLMGDQGYFTLGQGPSIPVTVMMDNDVRTTTPPPPFFL